MQRIPGVTSLSSVGPVDGAQDHRMFRRARIAGEYLPRAIGDYLAAHHRLVDPQAVALAIIHRRRGEIRARLSGCCSYNPGSSRCHAPQQADWFECYCTAAIQFPGGQTEFQRLLDEYRRLRQISRQPVPLSEEQNSRRSDGH